MLFKIICVWWIKPLVPALERLRQVDYYEFETRQSKIQRSNAVWLQYETLPWEGVGDDFHYIDN